MMSIITHRYICIYIYIYVYISDYYYYYVISHTYNLITIISRSSYRRNTFCAYNACSTYILYYVLYFTWVRVSVLGPACPDGFSPMKCYVNVYVYCVHTHDIVGSGIVKPLYVNCKLIDVKRKLFIPVCLDLLSSTIVVVIRSIIK